MAISLGNIRDGETDFTGDSLWDDEDTRTFYESLVDLRAFVPAVLLGDKPRMCCAGPCGMASRRAAIVGTGMSLFLYQR